METHYYFDIYTFLDILCIIWLYSFLFTLFISLVFSFSSSNIFKKVGKEKVYSYIPLYNLFVLLDIVKMSRWNFIFLLLPAINVFFIFVILYRLSIVFNTKIGFAFGLIFVPFVFVPILNYGSKVNFELEDEKKDDVTEEMVSLLTEEQYNELNKVEEVTPKVDNVFKAPNYNEEPVPAFKANRIKYEEMVMPEEKKEEIKRVEPVKVQDIYNNRFINTKVTEEDDSIEIVEL